MYVATTVSGSYIFQGFGTTQGEAEQAMVNEINQFLGEDFTQLDIMRSEDFMEVEVCEVSLGYGMTSVRN